MISPLSGFSNPAHPLNKRRYLRPFRRLETLLVAFTPGERLVLYTLTVIFALSAFALLVIANRAVSVTVPAPGGALTEGEIGPARFLNPVLTLSQADEDLTELVYSGLTRALPDGTVIPDLAESYTISPDGTTYTFKLRANATFQDGSPVTAADIVYTVGLIQNPAIKSPRRADWEGVVVAAPDTHTVVFKLPKSYAPFIENTSLGILPEHLWRNTDAEEFPFNPLNTHPIGSGPYQIASVETDSTGSPTKYTLEPFKHFALGAPYLSKITFLFHPNTEAEIAALNQHQIDALAGITPDQLADVKRIDLKTITVPLPRIFGIFFNQSHATVLADSSVRAALNAAVDKNRLVSMALSGYGVTLAGPILPANSAMASTTKNVSTAYTLESIAAAKAALANGGWKYDDQSGTWQKNKQTLTFTLATADAPELVNTADAVATAWRQVGVQVSVQVYPIADLNTGVIRPRNYDAILFGEVVGRSLDLFAFWHSSQRNDPGLNLALYANSKADTLLAQARATTDARTRDKLYSQFADLLAKDQPAVFLYAPEFIYVLPQELHGLALTAMTDPSDRFLGVASWYTSTEHVWNIFASSDQLN